MVKGRSLFTNGYRIHTSLLRSHLFNRVWLPFHLCRAKDVSNGFVLIKLETIAKYLGIKYFLPYHFDKTPDNPSPVPSGVFRTAFAWGMASLLRDLHCKTPVTGVPPLSYRCRFLIHK